MYTPVNPSFTIEKWDVRGSSLHELVFMMNSCASALADQSLCFPLPRKYTLMILNFRTDWSANSADPDQTAPRGAV